MKKLWLVSLILAVGVQIGRILDGFSKMAAAGGGQGGEVERCAARNGDVNADGMIDVTDAVTILRYQFLGEPTELLPLCESPPVPSGPLGTNQAECYDFDEGQGWIVVPCAETSCPGQDAAYTIGCRGEERYVDNGDGTVTDNCTGLMWQKDSADVNGDGKPSDQDYTQWCDALKHCERLSFAGHDDWRLPNVRELQTIVDYGRSSPSIDSVFETQLAVYWTSTSNALTPIRAWGVYFHNGFVISDFREAFYYVRAVRDTP